MADPTVSLSDMIAAVRQELSVAQAEGRKKNIRFEIKDVEIEAKVVVKQEGGGKIGVKIWGVFEAGLDGKQASETCHTIKFKMGAISASDDKPLTVGATQDSKD